MTGHESEPPVAADDFPEFAEPPRHRPPVEPEPTDEETDEVADNGQNQVDEVIARLRSERGRPKE